MLNAGLAPRLEEDGTGGTYFIQNGASKKSTVAVFKPADEEQLTPNNPKDLIGRMGQESMRKGIPSGAGCLREGALAINVLPLHTPRVVLSSCALCIILCSKYCSN